MTRNKKIIQEIRTYLMNEGLYTAKDEISLILLENTYVQYVKAYEDVKKNGSTIDVYDYNENVKTIINPSFRNYLELQKELFKIIDSLYLSPKSRKANKSNIDTKEGDDVFLKLMKTINDDKI